MNKLVFGSTALLHWYPDLKRNPKDTDVIGKGKNINNQWGRLEYHWVPSFQYILNHNTDPYAVEPNYLYTIKVSHACYDINWEKTMNDIRFMKSKGCKLVVPLYESLLKDWEVVHGAKKIKLKGTANEFFKTTVTRKMDHDKLHDLVKFYDRPLHESIRKDKNDVAVSKKLWDSLSEEDKLKCALEEAYVFAFERYIDYPHRIALSKALKNLIISSTKGYFNLFLIDNFFEMLYFNKARYLELYERYKAL
jgi:hypothetical protein